MSTRDIPADGLTKALPPQAHSNFVKHLNLYDISTRIAIPDSPTATAESEGVCQT